MFHVVGYEGGGADKSYALIWGAAAVRDSRGVLNAALQSEYQPRLDPEEWAETTREGAATAIEVEIPIEKIGGPYFVADMAKEVAARAPYHIKEPDDFWMEIHGIVAVGHGPTRTYYVFKSHEAVQSWIYHLNAGKNVLVPFGQEDDA